MSGLIGCPMCGGAAELGGKGMDRWAGACTNADCQTEGPMRKGREAATAAWNRRASPLDMPAPDRIALARELLAGTGRVVARDVVIRTEHGGLTPFEMGKAKGWNACRAAMLEPDDAGG